MSFTNPHDKTYIDLLTQVIGLGHTRDDRTGTGTVGMFGLQARFDIRRSFPLLTTKKVHWPSIVHELIWFLKGDTNIKYLNDNGVKIWNEWATKEGDLGPVYGAQWRRWEGPGVIIDQIEELLRGLRNDPYSRRHIVSAWNPAVLPDTSHSPSENAEHGLQALPPCHTLFQFHARPLDQKERLEIMRKKVPGLLGFGQIRSEEHWHEVFDEYGIPKFGLSCQLYQRSADMFLGVPFNIASYSLLTYMVAHVTNMAPLEFIWTGGDCHIYKNHMLQVAEQMEREHFPAPTVKIIGEHERLEDIGFEDIVLENYQHQPAIKAPIAV